MRWKKLGQIFDTARHGLPEGRVGFAQSPQVLEFPDFVRIYFSTRSLDEASGKFLSHIAYIDMQKDIRTIIGMSRGVVLPLGELGAFDEHGIFPINVLRHAGEIYGYTCGWNRRVSVSVDTAIGLVVSKDEGRSFERIGSGPVLGPSLREPCLVGDGFVKVVNGVFHMWYIFGTGWRKYSPDGAPDRTYKIGHAVSTDGVNWTKEEARAVIPDCLGDEESQALPTVVEVDGIYRMFFCYRESFDFRKNPNRGYRIGHAWSKDLKDWVRADDELKLEGTQGEWDSDMQCYPHAFNCEGQTYLLYNGNEFGRHGFGLAVLEK